MIRTYSTKYQDKIHITVTSFTTKLVCDKATINDMPHLTRYHNGK